MIYVNRKNRVPYLKLGESQYKNLHTDVSGEIKSELADKIFKKMDDGVFLRAINKNPNFLELVKSLKLFILEESEIT